MQAFEFASPTSVEEVISLLSEKPGETEILAGGTDLLSCLKDELCSPKRVISLRKVSDLRGVSSVRGGLRIGAMATVQELLDNTTVRNQYPALALAAQGITSPQIRNAGTVGGDLCQHPRCWYYRQGFGLLAKDKAGKSLVPEGENKYHAIFGGGPAYFVSASSFGPALVALGATVSVMSGGGMREIPAEQFFVAPKADGEREIALKPNELVVEIIVPSAAGVANATYEVRQKEALDWPLAAASVALKMKGNAITSARVVLGHVAPTPWVAAGAEKALAGKTLSDAVADEAGKAAVAGAKPLSQNGYKVQLARVAVKRALLAAAGRA